jgi:hypothetical protein
MKVVKEEELVTAASRDNLKEDSSSATSDIVNSPLEKSSMHIYKKDQWNSLNPEGKSRHERDCLMKLQNDPQTKMKPETLSELKNDTNWLQVTNL